MINATAALPLSVTPPPPLSNNTASKAADQGKSADNDFAALMTQVARRDQARQDPSDPQPHQATPGDGTETAMQDDDAAESDPLAVATNSADKFPTADALADAASAGISAVLALATANNAAKTAPISSPISVVSASDTTSARPGTIAASAAAAAAAAVSATSPATLIKGTSAITTPNASAIAAAASTTAADPNSSSTEQPIQIAAGTASTPFTLVGAASVVDSAEQDMAAISEPWAAQGQAFRQVDISASSAIAAGKAAAVATASQLGIVASAAEALQSPVPQLTDSPVLPDTMIDASLPIPTAPPSVAGGAPALAESITANPIKTTDAKVGKPLIPPRAVLTSSAIGLSATSTPANDASAATGPASPSPATIVNHRASAETDHTQPDAAIDSAIATEVITPQSSGSGSISDVAGASVPSGAEQIESAESQIQRHLDLAKDSAWLDKLTHDIVQTSGREGQLKFQLNPEHLGALSIEISHSANGATIRMTTDTDAARAIIADAQPRLVAEARAQGLRISEAQVDLSGQNGGNSNQRPTSEDQKPFLRTQAIATEAAVDSPSRNDERYA